jgi:hypothetical protein
MMDIFRTSPITKLAIVIALAITFTIGYLSGTCNVHSKVSIQADSTLRPDNNSAILSTASKLPLTHSAIARKNALTARLLFPQLFTCPPKDVPHITQEVSYSQLGEDRALFKKYFSSPVKTSGFFVEMGAVDGTSISNTLFFERHLNWRGLLIEVAPMNSAKLISTSERPGTVRVAGGCCDWSVGSLEVVNEGAFVANVKSAAGESFSKAWNLNSNNVVQVNCVPLSALLHSVGLLFIDLFSLDVEGSELVVLQTFDWETTFVHVWCIEMAPERESTNLQIADLLTSKGYKRDLEIDVHVLNQVWLLPNYDNLKAAAHVEGLWQTSLSTKCE